MLAGKRREESERKSKLYVCWLGREEQKKGKGLNGQGERSKKSLMGRPKNLVIRPKILEIGQKKLGIGPKFKLKRARIGFWHRAGLYRPYLLFFYM